MQFFDKNDNRNYVIRIPTAQGRRLFVYYRRYVKQDSLDSIVQSKKTMYQVFQDKLKKPEEKAPAQKLGGISMKTFSNPLTNPKEEFKPKTEDEILEDIPANRTLFVYNFDTEFDEKQVRFWFKTMGKIRTVFVAKHKGKKSGGTDNATNKVFFALVIFKNAKELQTCIDHPEVLQERINVALRSLNIKVDENDKIKYKEALVKKYATEELAGGDDEFVRKMEEDGFTMVRDHTGGFQKFTRSFGEENKEEEEGADLGPKKKKKVLYHDNFYRFQVKNNTAMKEMGLEHFKNFKNRRGDDVVGQKVSELRKGFQEDIERLREMRKQKAGQLDDEDDE